MNKEIKHALEVCKRVMQHACEVGDSDWSVYSGFREARQAIEAAEQKRAADSAKAARLARQKKAKSKKVAPAKSG